MKKLFLILTILLLSTKCFADEVKIQVNFTSDDGKFADTLNLTEADFTQDEWNSLNAILATKGLDEQKKARLDAHVAFMKSLATPVPFTKEQLQAQSTSVDSQISELQDKKIDLEAKIASMG